MRLIAIGNYLGKAFKYTGGVISFIWGTTTSKNWGSPSSKNWGS